MHREGSIELLDAAVAVHTGDGKVKIEETADPSGKTWGKRGAIAGGLVGLIFPPSIIAGALVGGAGGGVWGKLRDKGGGCPSSSCPRTSASDRRVPAAHRLPRRGGQGARPGDRP
jgi:hypothetical protein